MDPSISSHYYELDIYRYSEFQEGDPERDLERKRPDSSMSRSEILTHLCREISKYGRLQTRNYIYFPPKKLSFSYYDINVVVKKICDQFDIYSYELDALIRDHLDKPYPSTLLGKCLSVISMNDPQRRNILIRSTTASSHNVVRHSYNTLQPEIDHSQHDFELVFYAHWDTSMGKPHYVLGIYERTPHRILFYNTSGTNYIPQDFIPEFHKFLDSIYGNQYNQSLGCRTCPGKRLTRRRYSSPTGVNTQRAFPFSVTVVNPSTYPHLDPKITRCKPLDINASTILLCQMIIRFF